MSGIPDKIMIDEETGQLSPKAEKTDQKTMIIEINGKKETVTPEQAWSLAISILYQLRLMDEHSRG
jgi:hypothetical protein